MNQILLFKNSDNFSNYDGDTNQKNKKNFFKFQYIICAISAILILIYYLYNLYNNYIKEQISKKLVNDFNIRSLYSNSLNYDSTQLSTNYYAENQNKFSVIGLIEINSININYPILSTVSEELLKIAPCRFFGPMPNEIGNMCIAGHNYNNYKFFSKLKNLKIGDTINIYDLTGTKVTYSVYDSFETDYNDLTCTNQNTNNLREITLVTCNNIKNKRRIIKAKEQKKE